MTLGIVKRTEEEFQQWLMTEPGFVAALSVARFHGVGPATAAKMERLGILTGADLRARPLPFLREHFGKAGNWYYRISRGIDERAVQPHRPRKSLGTEDTFLSDIFDLETARAEVETLAAKVWRQASDRHLHARTVTLKVKYADFQQITRSRTLSVPLSSSAELEGLSIALLDPLFPTRKGIRLLGVTVSTLSAPDETEPAEARQLSLF